MCARCLLLVTTIIVVIVIVLVVVIIIVVVLFVVVVVVVVVVVIIIIIIIVIIIIILLIIIIIIVIIIITIVIRIIRIIRLLLLLLLSLYHYYITISYHRTIILYNHYVLLYRLLSLHRNDKILQIHWHSSARAGHAPRSIPHGCPAKNDILAFGATSSRHFKTCEDGRQQHSGPVLSNSHCLQNNVPHRLLEPNRL